MTDIREIVARAVFKSDDFFGDSYADNELHDWGDGILKATVDGEINFSAIAPAIMRAGFAIVPVEPTEAMYEAALGAEVNADFIGAGYKAMLTAYKEGK